MTDNRQYALKPAAVISLITLFLLSVFSVIFYKERFFSDYATIAFDIINYDRLQIQVERYGSFITQMVPLLLSRCHAPLKAVLIGYSVSFTLFPLITALVLYRLKQYDLILLMGLYFTLYVSDTFFWSNNELHQAVTWMCLLYGIMRSTMNRNRPLAVKFLALIPFAAAAFLTIFTHPTVIIPFMFLWIYWWIDDRNFLYRSKVWPAIYLLVVVAILIYKFLASSRNDYDSANITRLLKANLQDVLNAFDNGMADSLWQGWISNYWFIPVLFLTALILLIRKKKYLLASWVIVANLGFFILVCLTFTELATFHLESELAPYSIMAGAAFVYYVLPALSKKQLVLVMTVIFVVRIIFIGAASAKFTERTNKIERIIAYMDAKKINKLIVLIGDRDKERDFIQSWAVPAESIYLSTLKNTTVSRTFILLNQQEKGTYQRASFKTGVLYPFVGFYPQEKINYFYFKPDMLSEYSTVDYTDIIGE